MKIRILLGMLCLLFVYPLSMHSNVQGDSIKEILLRQNTINDQYIRLLAELSFETWEDDAIEAKSYAEKALHLADSLKDSLGRAYATLGIGLGLWAQEDFNKSMEHFLEAERLVGLYGDSADIMYFKFQIALAYQDERILDLSNRSFRLLIPYAKKVENRDLLARTFKGYGMNFAYEKSQDPDDRYKSFRLAILYLDSAQQIFTELGNDFELIDLALYQGLASLQLEDFVDAQHLCNKALNGYRKYEDYRGEVKAEKEIGNTFLSIGQPDSAEVHYQRALDMAEKNELKDVLYEIYYALYELEYARENYQAALANYKKHIEFFDKRLNRQISYQVHEMKMKYDKEKNEQEILLLNQTKKLQNTYIIALSIIIIVISISAVLIAISFRNGRRKANELSRSKEALMQAEISNARLKEKELTVELEKKNMELTSYTMNFIQKGTLLTELLEKLSEIKEEGNEKTQSTVRELRNIIKRNLSSDKDWDDFKTYFDNAHPSFVKALRNKKEDLSSTEIRLAALLKLNLNSKQIADVMGISPDSVKTARHRLRNKFELQRDQNLTQYLNQLEAAELVAEN